MRICVNGKHYAHSFNIFSTCARATALSSLQGTLSVRVLKTGLKKLMGAPPLRVCGPITGQKFLFVYFQAIV